eukprot:COSAG01_NODE_3316_length_6272_cov_4.305376_6_plen_199_part_00
MPDALPVSGALSSCTRPILAEIYRCHACSCHEIYYIEDGDTRPGRMVGADLSNLVRPFPIAKKWAHLILEEFCQQGDTERRLGLPVSPLCERSALGTSAQVKRAVASFLAAVLTEIYLCHACSHHEIHLGTESQDAAGHRQLRDRAALRAAGEGAGWWRKGRGGGGGAAAASAPHQPRSVRTACFYASYREICYLFII